MLRAVSTTDWHLEKLTRLFGDKALGIQMSEVEKPFIYAVENGIKHVFISGDITDKPSMSDDAMLALMNLMWKYDAHVKTYYIPGNHDFKEAGRSSVDVLASMCKNKAFKNFEIISTVERRTIDGVDVVFVPYPNTSYEVTDPAVVIAHVEYGGALGDNGRPLKNPSGYHRLDLDPNDVLISGHLHTHQTVGKRGRILFTGAPYQTTFGEHGQKGFCEIRARMKEGRLLFKHTFVNSRPCFKLINLHVEASTDWDKVRDNPKELYKISVGAGVVVPKGIMTERPNIVSIDGSYNSGYVDAETVEATANDMPKITPLTGLKSFLQNSDLSLSEKRLAMAEAKAVLRKIRNESAMSVES